MTCAPPANHAWVDPTPFQTLGIRIPGMVVSPLVEAGACFSGLLDHTSILQLMVDRFGDPADLAAFGHAVARKANQIQSVASVLTRTSPRTSDILSLPAAPPPVGQASPAPLTDAGRMFQGVLADKPARQV